MNIDRRSFIQAVAIVASSSALMPLLPVSSIAGGSSVQSPAEAAVSDSVVFTIDGWDLDKHGLSQNEVRIRVNQSWRSAWRCAG